MIEIFRFDKKWRFKIVNETLEFDKREELQEELEKFLKLKEKAEPYRKWSQRTSKNFRLDVKFAKGLKVLATRKHAEVQSVWKNWNNMKKNKKCEHKKTRKLFWFESRPKPKWYKTCYAFCLNCERVISKWKKNTKKKWLEYSKLFLFLGKP